MNSLRAFMAGKWAAQEAKRAGQLRADDAAYQNQAGARWQTGAEVVNTDSTSGDAPRGREGVVPLPTAGPSGPLTHQRAKADAQHAQITGPDTRKRSEAGREGTRDAASSAPLYALVSMCRAAGLPEPIPEYRFHQLRRWRFDFAWPLHMVAVEVEGGIWTQGRHTRGPGVLADMEKYNAAVLAGWRVLRYAPQTLGSALEDLRLLLMGCSAIEP